MNFSMSSLAAGFVFGTFGIFIFREGKRKANVRAMVLAIILMVYTYFFENPFYLWGAGVGLLYIAYRVL